jgi:hypothetical protein
LEVVTVDLGAIPGAILKAILMGLEMTAGAHFPMVVASRCRRLVS